MVLNISQFFSDLKRGYVLIGFLIVPDCCSGYLFCAE